MEDDKIMISDTGETYDLIANIIDAVNTAAMPYEQEDCRKYLYYMLKKFELKAYKEGFNAGVKVNDATLIDDIKNYTSNHIDDQFVSLKGKNYAEKD